MSYLPWWPSSGPIDLATHDLPHAEADTEWWYVNAHVEAADGRRFGLFAAFFQIIEARDDETGAVTHAHSMTWAISDLAEQRYLGESRVDRRAPQIGLERIRHNRGARDERLNRAMQEILGQDRVPTPDRRFDGEVHVATDRLHLEFGNGSFEKTADRTYGVRLAHADQKTGCDLVFRLEKPPCRHGVDGVVRGGGGELMFYYFVPRCSVTGTLRVNGQTLQVARGQGWYDHEFGAFVAPEGDAAAAGTSELGWNWTAIQLDDGTDITACETANVRTLEPVNKGVIVIDAAGRQRTIADMTLVPTKMWTSMRTFHAYPIEWRLTEPSIGLDLTITAAFDDQELVTVISKPAFWEGACAAKGTLGGRAVEGRAYVERSGFENIDTLDDFFAAVGKEVRRSTAALLPLTPTYAELRDLIASEELGHYMEGVDIPSLADALIRPIREIVDRGGKSWRSYAALACCDVVGGDSRKYMQWLAIPELMHVGSLIVDDVQDKSTVRRGGPSAHVIHGEPIAINAGTAAYFLTQNLLADVEMSDKDRIRVYDLYFAAMRAGHAGQAIDLRGMAALMPAAVETGDYAALEARVLACQRLKTAAPAGCLARMGAVVGGGSDAQIAAVGEFFEAVGLAFQIMDDVLNLRGFKGDLKQRGEDITNGTVTLVIAAAMGRLAKPDRQWLWATLQSRPTDPAVVAAAIEMVTACGALDACADRAREFVEAGWAKAEPLLAPSLPRVMLRAFGWYVLERYY